MMEATIKRVHTLRGVIYVNLFDKFKSKKSEDAPMSDTRQGHTNK